MNQCIIRFFSLLLLLFVSVVDVQAESVCDYRRGGLRFAAWVQNSNALSIAATSRNEAIMLQYLDFQTGGYDISLDMKAPSNSTARFYDKNNQFTGQISYDQNFITAKAWEIFWNIWYAPAAEVRNRNYDSLTVIYVAMLDWQTWAPHNVSVCR